MIARSAFFNLVGLGAPLIVAVFTIPPLIEALGTARFGLLTLIWVIVSYVGLFDLGLGRTLTLQLSVAESRGERHRIGPAVATALVLMLALGLVTGLALALAAAQGVDLLASVPDRAETITAIQAMGVAIPAITLTSGFRGILEARGAFFILNVIRLPLGIFTFVGPLAAAMLAEPRLDVIAWVLVAGRYAGLAAHAAAAIRHLPRDAGAYRLSRAEIGPLFTLGGWLTVSNIVSPLMAYADRFVIGALVSASAVAFYATPHEIVTKLWIIPGALTTVLFPVFAEQIASRSGAGVAIFRQSVAALFLMLLPICAALALLAPAILTIWISAEFAREAAHLLQIFTLGVLANTLAHVPFTFIQSAERPKITALVHLAEAVPFLLILAVATLHYGATGAALAWLARILIDTGVMFWLAGRVGGFRIVSTGAKGLVLYGGLAAFAYAGLMIAPLEWRLVWLVVTACVAGAMLVRGQRALLTRLLGRAA